MARGRKPSTVRRTGASPDSTAIILDSIADGVFTVDTEWHITYFNRAAERITGIPRDDAIGKPCCEVFRASICESSCALKRTLADGKSLVNVPVHILRADGTRLPISISTALLRDESGAAAGGVETFRDLSEIEALRKEVSQAHSFADMIARSAPMREVFAMLPRIAESGATALVTGESGTGKELVARALHSLSPRRKKPFVAVNCAALPESLLESELFGHVAGAFTDAKRDRKGRFAQAAGGTIFLDEIGDMAPSLQTKLLRVLQEREYEPVGSGKTVKSDARVVCATNRDLDALVDEGVFRQDLYYRVNVVRIELPPLRDRKEDIPLLVSHFVGHHSHVAGRAPPEVSPEALSALMSHDWPGNIRELENAIEHALATSASDHIERAHLPTRLRPGAEPPQPGVTLSEIEKQAIHEALERNGWRKLATARELGINKTTLWRKAKTFGIREPE
jgi:PAS domain S-box-containing protein